jgi:hypothetical protein
MHVRSVWDRLPWPWDNAWWPVRKGRTGLTDPRPPAPTMWEESFDEAVAFEADAVLRDAALEGSDVVGAWHRRRGERRSLPAFSPAVRHAVRVAIHDAACRGVDHADPQHLLIGPLSQPESAANRLLREWRIPEHPSKDRVVRTDPGYHEKGAQSTWAAPQLTFWRVSPVARLKLWRWPWRTAVWLLVRRPLPLPRRPLRASDPAAHRGRRHA